MHGETSSSDLSAAGTRDLEAPPPIDAVSAADGNGHSSPALAPERNGHRAGTPAASGRRVVSPSLVALLTWLACLPVAFELPQLGPFNPFHLRIAMVPVELGVALLVLVAIATRWIRADLASAIGAGLFAGWAAFTMRLALHGTPYGFGGLDGDTARITAMANHYTTIWHSADQIVPSVPSDYPPLYPWLVGHAAALTHIPAWRLLGPAEILTTSVAVVAGFVLWRRLVSGPVALAVSIVPLAIYPAASHAYEVLALAVFAPWALAAFGRPPRGGLRWLPAGLIGGLMVLWYQEYLIFAALGLVALVAVTWRASRQRGSYLRHVALTVAVAAVVGSFYLVPYLGWSLMHQVQEAGDLFQGGGIQTAPLPFLALTPLAVLELIGLAGLFWYRRRAFWATPLLLLTASCYAYWLLFLLVFTVSGHTGMLQFTPHLIEPLLATSGVLTIVEAAPGVIRRTGSAVPPALPVVALCVLVAWAAVGAWQNWMPGGPPLPGSQLRPEVTDSTNLTSDAFAYALPDGSYPRFYAPHHRVSGMPAPVDRIAADVRSVRGPGASPATVSVSESLFDFVNWPGYIAADVSAAGSDTDWFSRYAVLARLARTGNPATFAQQSAHTPFGPIGVFLLQRTGQGWIWAPWDYPSSGKKSGVLVFHARQFSRADFTVFTNLPGNLVLAVRRAG